MSASQDSNDNSHKDATIVVVVVITMMDNNDNSNDYYSDNGIKYENKDEHCHYN